MTTVERLGSKVGSTAVSEEAAATLRSFTLGDQQVQKALADGWTYKQTDVAYQDEGTELMGLAVWVERDDASRQILGERPCVLVCPTAVGLREDFLFGALDRYASLGYVAFGVDMYGEGAVWDKGRSRAIRQPLTADRTKLQRRMVAAYQAAQSLPQVQEDNIAVVGYCFGGMCALDLARAGVPMKGVVSFHGVLDRPAVDKVPGGLSCPVLVHHGSDDPFISPDQFQAFQQELSDQRTDWQIHIYGGAKHSFTRPEKVTQADRDAGLQYCPKSERRSYRTTKAFLQDIFPDFSSPIQQ
ncbi:unnamed protein product [Vitrella brassicaformis CCMP3155]|uniref:Dienelactone hydrolase domain-containing protein n=1 Tax=Vitrella brassicaformis (strain CCMP3155) TaxID=1169540 RepID=A0A0G4EJ35_VITBC|nr:unnamed protein product [Vitrella brassicaformis CCMP3155]|eukprot:CEL96223.1 unnamed protein product [Vitrella brassicaformis CCMP3155]